MTQVSQILYSGSLAPCQKVNPALWRLYCYATDRDPSQDAAHWTEHDVFVALATRCRPGITVVTKTETDDETRP